MHILSIVRVKLFTSSPSISITVFAPTLDIEVKRKKVRHSKPFRNTPLNCLAQIFTDIMRCTQMNNRALRRACDFQQISLKLLLNLNLHVITQLICNPTDTSRR